MSVVVTRSVSRKLEDESKRLKNVRDQRRTVFMHTVVNKIDRIKKIVKVEILFELFAHTDVLAASEERTPNETQCPEKHSSRALLDIFLHGRFGFRP